MILIVLGCLAIVHAVARAEDVAMTPAEFAAGAAEIRARGYPCIDITRVIIVEPLAQYRVECQSAAYLVTGQVEGLAFVPTKLIPLTK
jgi:hypothetical protein